MKYLLIYISVAAFLFSCGDDFDFDPDLGDVQRTSGEADFSKFVSVGNSLTAGFADGALYKSAQENSYPAIMAEQMMLAGGGNFTQPLMADDIGGFANIGVEAKLVLNAQLSPVRETAVSNFSLITGTYNNVGVPGAKAVHLLFPGYGVANPYFGRFASSPTATVIADAMVQNPTFFSLWIGNNDVLGYATSGGSSDVITPTADFQTAYTGLVQTLVSGGAKGVVANLPYVTSIPYFTTVPYNALSPDALGGATQINTLNAQLYGPLSQVLTAIGEGSRISMLSATEANPLLIHDESLTNIGATLTAVLQMQGIPAAQAGLMGQLYGQARQATADDLPVLTSSAVIGTSNISVPAPFNVEGVTYPLQDGNVLTQTEVAECTTATDAYNNIIANLANTYDLAYYDAQSDMNLLQSNSGIVYNGVSFSSSFVTGGAFSLDGVHPTSSGYAIIANGFINSINNKYGSNLPMVNPADYPGVTFP